MKFASVALDISTRGLGGTFDYSIPETLESSCEIGATVLVNFAHRMAVGYVVGLSDTPTTDIDPIKIKQIQEVLAPASFDDGLAQLAIWMSDEYAAPLPDCLRLMIAPGQKVKVKRESDNSPWELVCQRTGKVDERIVSLTEKAKEFEPKSTAPRQREVIEALSGGPVRMAELSAMINGVSGAVKALEKKGIVKVETRRRIRTVETSTLSSAVAKKPLHYTSEQSHALDVINAAIDSHEPEVILIDGVTGSGKTEVYLSAIEKVLNEGKNAIVLVPEISLTAQTVGRFRSRFGDLVAVLHSRLSTGERFDQWDLVRQGKARVVVGARSALFAPMKNVGIIIIDEEHESSYKQELSPRYHAREVAEKLAEIRNCPLVLGTATPSLESIARCETGSHNGISWQSVRMLERPGEAQLPSVKIVDMRNQFQRGNNSVFSSVLLDEIEGVIERREKAILLLNRRGFSNFLMCRECGCVPECPHCSTALTYHEKTHTLECHSCGKSWSVVAYPNPATSCPNCKSRYMAQYGVGTERVEAELEKIVDGRCDVIRMDWDSTRTKGAHQELLEKFDASECAILIGTQMIAKGLDFPEVTLAGVINADTTLKLPDFRAAEKTYCLLEQIAGRSGRGEKPGKVIIQTYWSTHPVMEAIKRKDREIYLDSELEEREDALYPPYVRLSNVIAWGKNKAEAEKFINEYACILNEKIAHLEGWHMLGPVDCVRSKVQDRWRFHILLKSPLDSHPGPLLTEVYREIGSSKTLSVAIDVDAYDMM